MRTRRRRAAIARSGLVALLLIWAGMLLGVSFLASPAKFGAPSLSLPTALDVGRQVFGTYNRVEIALALATLALALLGRVSAIWPWLVLALVWAIVAVQSIWLLPILDARVGTILEGGQPPEAPWHLVYVALEVIKLVALLTAAGLSARRTEGGAAAGAAREPQGIT